MKTETLNDYSQEVLIIFTTISVVCLLFILLALVAINRTKSTPKTARFLSSGLLLLDFLAVFCFMIRKFINHPSANIVVQVFGVCWLLMSEVTVVIMSFERLFAFSRPNAYLRHVSLGRVKLVTYSIWVSFFCVYLFVRYGLCFLNYRGATLYDVIGKCNSASFVFFGICMTMVIVASVVCYFRIYFIIRYQNGKGGNSQTFKANTYYIKHVHKHTLVVCVYIMTIILVHVGYILIIKMNLDTTAFLLSVDAIHTLKCILAPCLYAIWFKECRMEMMKVFSFGNKRSLEKIERMRMEVFNIVVSDFKVEAERSVEYDQSE